MRIKVCGLRRAEDAALAAALGAHALGFVFAPGKRTVSLEEARRLTATLPPWVSRVGVFSAEQLAEAPAIAEQCRLDTLQLHGEPDLDFLAHWRSRFTLVQALGVGDSSAEELRARIAAIAPHVDGLLLDTAAVGGTGVPFDWQILRKLDAPVPLLIAGGLNADNVGRLLATATPWGVDLASGVESAPGVKDPERLHAFFRAVASAAEAPVAP